MFAVGEVVRYDRRWWKVMRVSLEGSLPGESEQVLTLADGREEIVRLASDIGMVA